MAGGLSPCGGSPNHVSPAKKVEDRTTGTLPNFRPEAINAGGWRESDSGWFAGRKLGEQIGFARLGERHLDLLRIAPEQGPEYLCLSADHRGLRILDINLSRQASAFQRRFRK